MGTLEDQSWVRFKWTGAAELPAWGIAYITGTALDLDVQTVNAYSLSSICTPNAIPIINGPSPVPAGKPGRGLMASALPCYAKFSGTLPSVGGIAGTSPGGSQLAPGYPGFRVIGNTGCPSGTAQVIRDYSALWNNGTLSSDLASGGSASVSVDTWGTVTAYASPMLVSGAADILSGSKVLIMWNPAEDRWEVTNAQCDG